ncbi:hypothetical protein TVAG_001630 [Trichomonas vaginalis G3]|uniref:DSC E3 ubiquitin ligase complex subunit 3 C-terminal domain-containing protein n=1 Tax=Trichomonas vaginalis (strain ATCC PRA-98 / G3) TaxID=412133 RepID=A2FSX1_TRIV3|nr:DUF2407 C-terminal domain-containing protein [Trichomonas vaginalis G3]EAX91993.1 hypothetical protein TVAG_001630 [Trichomonas vaginalis G3]KAI5528948.1 DUF2407 C-terminal domain-containing protein [Trichomonas vaginalis G3]|eukprot:XP_001304923.1 hypothetical protein [Trichomonas vaginalis G3]
MEESPECPLLTSQELHENDFPVNAVFPDGSRKSYNFTRSTTVGDLIKTIQSDSSVVIPKDKSICIIYRGRILKSVEKFSEIDSVPDYTVTILFRLNKSDIIVDKEDLESELRGFDRLTRMNYTPEQIQEIRLSFHTMRGGLNDTDDQKYEAEEEWLPVIFNSDNPLEAFQAADAERPVQVQNTPRHNEVQINTEISGTIVFLFALCFGLIFGPFSLLLLFVSFHDVFGIGGLVVGSAINIILYFAFGFSIF